MRGSTLFSQNRSTNTSRFGEGPFYEYAEFETLSYEQKLRYVLFLGHFQGVLELSQLNQEDDSALEDSPSSSFWRDSALEKLNALFAIIFKEVYGFQVVPITQPNGVVSTGAKALSSVAEVGDWIEGEFTRVVEPIKKTGFRFGATIVKLAKGLNVADLLLYSSDLNENEDEEIRKINAKLMQDHNAQLKRNEASRRAKKGKLAGNESDSIGTQLEKTKIAAGSQSQSAKRKIASLKSKKTEIANSKGDMCLFGGWVSSYAPSSEPKVKRHCLPPKGKINSKSCPRRKFGNPTFECNNFGLSQNFNEEVLSPKLCVPLYVNGKIGDLTLRCTNGLTEMMNSTVKGINPQVYNQSVKNIKQMWDEFKGPANKDMTVKQYCDSENLTNGKIQQVECKAIVDMIATLEWTDRYIGPDSNQAESQTK